MEQKAPLPYAEDDEGMPPELEVYDDIRGGQLPADIMTETAGGGFLSRFFRPRNLLIGGGALGAGGTAYTGYVAAPGSRSATGAATPQQSVDRRNGQYGPAAPAARQVQQTAGGQAAPQAPQAQAQAARPARDALASAETRVLEEQRERRGLSPFDLAMIQLGLGMMGSSRASPLAAMSDAAGPALNTYVALDRNRENADLRRESERNRILRDRAMMERYDEDRASRERMQDGRLAQALQIAAARRAGGGGGGGGSSGLSREDAAYARSLMTRRAALISGGGGTNMSPQDRAAAVAAIDGEIGRLRGGASPSSRNPVDPMGLLSAPTE